jgi:protein O-mannosyl-transferase
MAVKNSRENKGQQPPQIVDSPFSPGPLDANHRRERKRNLLIGLGLVVLTLLAWGRVVRNPFINYDDRQYVTQNPNIQAGLNWKTLSWALTSIDQANWHPLTWLSHALDYQLFGLNPAGSHLTSLLLHLVNVVLLYLLLYGATRKVGRGFLVAGLFAIHPLNVESVAWVAERKNVLCTFFLLLALAAYGRYVRKPDSTRYLLVVVLFLFALASKPMAITLPCLLLLLDVWPLRRILTQARQLDERRDKRRMRLEAQPANTTMPMVPLSRAILEKLPLLALSAASAAVTIYAQGHGGAPIPSTEELSLVLRFQNAIRAYCLYAGKAFFPVGLAPMYPHPGSAISTWQVVLAAIFFSLVSLWAFTKRKRAPYLLVGWLWFLGSLVPVIGILQVGQQAMADRYAYIPLIGVFVMTVWSVADLADRVSLGYRWRVAISAVVLCTFSFLTWRQIGFWHSSLDLWAHTLAVTSNNQVAETNMSAALVEAGRLDEAIPHFKNILRMDPHDATSYANIGAQLQMQGKLPDAISSYELALLVSRDPHLKAGVYVNLWTIYTKLGNFELAGRSFAQALESYPQFPEALIPDFLKSVNAHPLPQTCLQLGQLFEQAGRLRDARSAYAQALKVDPSFAPARTALARLNGSGQ